MSAAVEKYHTPLIIRRDYETPPAVFARYGPDCTLDVCALPETAKCERFFTPDQDGLSQDWGTEVCWMNPPYGREIRAWIKKAWDESRKGATVVCLLPARTDSGWWHDYAIKGEVTFLRGRIKFVGCEHNAPFPCAVVIFRPPTCEGCDGTGNLSVHGVEGYCGMCDGTGYDETPAHPGLER